MKRDYISIERIADYSNLVLAFHKAAKGKRYRTDVQGFLKKFNQNIHKLSKAILNQKMPYGNFREFTIYDPKKRIIHAACFEDRIFHHAIMNLAGSTLERAMSPYSYACRPQKGVHKAVKQVQKNLQRFQYYGKIDISGYFAAIDHEQLMQVLQRRYSGKAFIQQLHRIIQSHHSDSQQGLPIGSLTSQYFANYYLDGLDRYLESEPNVRAYARYMDDIIWWCDDRQTTKSTLQAIQQWLSEQRKLTVKQGSQVQSSLQGVTYCGFRITQGAVRLSKRKKQRFLQRRQYWEGLYQQGKVSSLQLQKAYASVHAIAAHTDSLRWRQENFRRFPALEV